MDSKSKAGDTLCTLWKEFDLSEKLEFYVSNEHNIKNTEFMKQIRHNNIDYNTSEKGYNNQNLFEGVIREIGENGIEQWSGRGFLDPYEIMACYG